jgi:signal transduction histidine kinase
LSINQTQKLQESREAVNEALYVYILNKTSDGLLWIDFQGIVLGCNTLAAYLCKQPQEEMVGRHYLTCFSDDFFGFSIKEAVLFGISHKLIYKTIDSKLFEITSGLFLGKTSKDHALCIWIKDISLVKQLQQDVQRNEALKHLGQLTAQVAHEIRNPLGSIRGFASLLARDLAQTPKLQEMVESIIEASKGLERLVSSVLHHTRPMKLELTSLDLGPFLKKTAQFFKMDPAYPPHIELKLHIPNHPMLVPLDPSYLKSAILNLLFNAVQAIPSTGTISLSLIQIEGWCQIEISDTGMGMDEITLQSIFSPLFTTKSQGNGLGLNEVAKIIKAHQGTIDVQSNVGKGTSFRIKLPLKRCI